MDIHTTDVFCTGGFPTSAVMSDFVTGLRQTIANSPLLQLTLRTGALDFRGPNADGRT